MEAVGTAAAFAELLSLSVEVSKAAKSLVQSFLNAPKGLNQLTTKLDLLHSHIIQFHCLSQELSASDLAKLLPQEHQTMLLTGLRTHHQTLQTIQSLCNTQSGKSKTLATRLRWAMLDKRKANLVLGKVSRVESQLNTTLAILAARLNFLNQTSLGVLNTNHALLHAKLQQSTEAVKGWVHVEIQRLAECSSQCTATSPKAANVVPKDDQESIVEVTAQEIEVAKTEASDSPTSKSGDIFNQAVSGKRQRLAKAPRNAYVHDQVDPGTRLIEHDMRKSLSHYSTTMGSLRQLSAADKPVTGALVTLQSKRNYRRLRLILDVAFNLFCQQIWQFELDLRQQTTRQWISMPRLNCSINVYNLRPSDAPIFLACQERDVHKVRYLLETGQASIYDVDDEIGGLLEHTVRGHYQRYLYKFDENTIQPTLEHLLDQGCDPSAFYGTITEHRLPAILFAFDQGYSLAATSLISRGADILSYGSALAGCFEWRYGKFDWKLKLARSIGYSDWHIESPLGPWLSDTILHGASKQGNVSEVLFALEIAGLDPNVEGNDRCTALGNAAAWNRLKSAVILIESGAEVDSSRASYHGTPLSRNIYIAGWFDDVTHYLLLQGADPQLKTRYGNSAWHLKWNVVCKMIGNRPRSWPFVRLEGELAHLLLHGADPFQLFTDPDPDPASFDTSYLYYHWYASKLHLRGMEIARSWSYGIARKHRNMAPSEEWIATFEDAEETRTPKVICGWSQSGMIYETSPKDNSQPPTNTKVEGDANLTDDMTQSQSSNTDDCANNDDDDDDNDTFFRAQSQFKHHISNTQGCRMLSRFPMALALCSALQFAGYRAEMDEDGDIWYEDEDGDPYFDAREIQPQGNDFTPNFCRICQDFEGHGLGHILETVEEARREAREYKEAVQARKKWF